MLRRCLEKDRKRRLSDAADARLEIEEALTTPIFETSAVPAPSQGGWRRGDADRCGRSSQSVGSRRAALSGPPPAPLRSRDADGDPDLRRDRPRDQPARSGRLRHYSRRLTARVHRGASQLVVRRFRIDSTRRRSPASASPTQPFVFARRPVDRILRRGLVLKKVAIGGGPAVTVVKDNNPSGGPLGATWGTDGTIVYASLARRIKSESQPAAARRRR